MADAFSGSSLTVDRSRQELTDGLVLRLEYSGFLVDAAGGTDPDETMDHNVALRLSECVNCSAQPSRVDQGPQHVV
ncbi:hypothetical protein, partial [Corynebacterium variabile]|uniref:hypothetical protein n=1 Tax=Corynebacterium variabile TaxID=1727 RepID=UPI003A952B39